MTTQLTAHFALEEFVYSATAAEEGIDNTPSPGVLAVLATTAQGLELVRALLGQSMHITSGYRSVALNKAVRGVVNSAHLTGHAADFVSPWFGSPLQIVEAVAKSELQFDQCIQEGTWVHISFDPAMRRQTLTAEFHEGGPTTYSEGVA